MLTYVLNGVQCLNSRNCRWCKSSKIWTSTWIPEYQWCIMMLRVWTSPPSPWTISTNKKKEMSSPDEVEVGGVAGTSWRIEVYHSFKQHSENPSNIQTWESIWIPKKTNPYHQHRSPQEVFWKRDMGLLFADETSVDMKMKLEHLMILRKPLEMSFFYEQYLFWMTILPSPQRPPIEI